ncbi:MAG: ribosome biogenesis GTP-binding protein YihA/YsxC [Desulfovibrio sp.]|jgi:GTP-binding protein|nr:ribosome biogenesis GTP-binding protein YihA/YsxC [Desulfovibrio sp.]
MQKQNTKKSENAGPAGLRRLSLAATAFTREQLIHAHAPQAAFAGRSNVGKSSLLNALAGTKKLARVSSDPGKTRSINYYRIVSAEAFVIDLPGYGYAKCSKEERQRWADLLDYYLRHSPGLKALMLLSDARLPPQKSDLDLLAFAAALALPALPVLTKTDKCNKKELQATFDAWTALTGHAPLATSAEKCLGLDELWSILLDLLMPHSI